MPAKKTRASLQPNYQYNATLNRVIDGDTVILDVDLGFNITASIDFRLAGINCPEVTGKTKAAGEAAKAATLSQLGSVATMSVVSAKTDKYGRWLGTIYLIDANSKVVCLNDWLVANGYAQLYDGEGPKPESKKKR